MPGDGGSTSLKQKLLEKIEGQRQRVQKLVKESGNVPIDRVTLGQIVGGARDVRCLVTDLSYLDPIEGIRFRGKTIPETLAILPRPAGAEMPYVEGFFYFLLTGEVPTAEQTRQVIDDWRARARVPQYVFDLLRAMPRDSHPMTMLSAAVVSMQRESIFSRRYHQGRMKKSEYWDATYEDAMNLIARLPTIAAHIYRMKYRGDTYVDADPSLDWAGSFAHLMEIGPPYDDVSRMYFIVHSDHESGNVSAHATHLVSSALSDPYYALAAGINGLAGPLHGLANQESLEWIQSVMARMGGMPPSDEELERFLWETLNAGQVIPGYGHAVLRKTDPRYLVLRDFAERHFPDYPMFQLVSQLYRVAPSVLTEQGKTRNPWPNLDAHSGVIQWYYGVTEYEFYTVLFAVGRALGVLANITWDRGLNYPIERPKSVTVDMLERWAKDGGRPEADGE
jgi:citrate synthase